MCQTEQLDEMLGRAARTVPDRFPRPREPRRLRPGDGDARPVREQASGPRRHLLGERVPRDAPAHDRSTRRGRGARARGPSARLRAPAGRLGGCLHPSDVRVAVPATSHPRGDERTRDTRVGPAAHPRRPVTARRRPRRSPAARTMRASSSTAPSSARRSDCPHDNLWFAATALYAGVAASAGTAEQRAVLTRALQPLASLWCMFGAGGAVFGTGHHWLGRLAASDGDVERATTHYERAMSLSRPRGPGTGKTSPPQTSTRSTPNGRRDRVEVRPCLLRYVALMVPAMPLNVCRMQ